MKTYTYAMVCVFVLALMAGSYWKGVLDQTAKIKACEMRSADKDAQIKAQNDAVATLKASSNKIIADTEIAVKAAQAKALSRHAGTARILASKPIGEECKAAESLFAKEMR